MVVILTIQTPGRGFTNITPRLQRAVQDAAAAGRLAADGSGLCTVFIRHTSASLVIQETADPTVRRDFEAFFARLARDGDPLFAHDDEGPDDMPAHIRAALTATSLSIPILDGRLGLGTWQAIYLWEHRLAPHAREVLVHVGP